VTGKKGTHPLSARATTT